MFKVQVADRLLNFGEVTFTVTVTTRTHDDGNGPNYRLGVVGIQGVYSAM